ncbi:MAG TPA: hypothetical protein VEI97_03080 [bacterium]|nr:hypothetical protein [bacterium]
MRTLRLLLLPAACSLLAAAGCGGDSVLNLPPDILTVSADGLTQNQDEPEEHVKCVSSRTDRVNLDVEVEDLDSDTLTFEWSPEDQIRNRRTQSPQLDLSLFDTDQLTGDMLITATVIVSDGKNSVQGFVNVLYDTNGNCQLDE